MYFGRKMVISSSSLLGDRPCRNELIIESLCPVGAPQLPSAEADCCVCSRQFGRELR
jgi:hypothetical protein